MCHLPPVPWHICSQPSWQLGFWIKWLSDPTQTSMSDLPAYEVPAATWKKWNVLKSSQDLFSFWQSLPWQSYVWFKNAGTAVKRKLHSPAWIFDSGLWLSSSRVEDDCKIENSEDFLPFVCSPGNFMMTGFFSGLPQILIITSNGCFQKTLFFLRKLFCLSFSSPFNCGNFKHLFKKFFTCSRPRMPPLTL